MSTWSILVEGWLVLNATLFAALMLRRNHPALRDRLFRWVIDGRRRTAAFRHMPSHDSAEM